MWFEACSGLKINLEKSELIPIGDVHNREEFVEKQQYIILKLVK